MFGTESRALCNLAVAHLTQLIPLVPYAFQLLVHVLHVLHAAVDVGIGGRAWKRQHGERERERERKKKKKDRQTDREGEMIYLKHVTIKEFAGERQRCLGGEEHPWLGP